ncbi:hypothetical protein NLI96_g9764 [Meripilus lineatus]|uniref:Uncharacterized protein n=1 Tax=Meripilus lineatus TaxID=2056292 RepID=A0AAD5UWI5_9APHY|nr:hypothetical protein NLI96_g9764 [Physisporinus lineatus]
MDTPVFHRTKDIRPDVGSSSLGNPFLSVSKGKDKETEDRTAEKPPEGIYSPRIRLEYRPPIALPAPFPRILSVEGLHLYTGSTIFMRHTMNALYSDLRVDIRHARVLGARPPNGPVVPPFDGGGAVGSNSMNGQRSMREKSLFLGLGITGAGRVSKANVEWEVNCTYTFSPTSGLILLHTIDSIEPTPHQALFEALGRFGLVGRGGGDLPGVGGAR